MLTISDYKNWAAQNQQTSVALSRDSDELVAESTRVGGLARAFKSGSVKAVRGAVVKDFTRALTSRYGMSIAQKAISMAGLSPTSQLKGWKIERAINAAKSLRAEMLQSTAGHDLRIGGADISGALVNAYLSDGRNIVAKFLRQRAVAVQLLGEMPLSQAEFNDFAERASDLVSRLVVLRNAAAVPGAVPEGISAKDFEETVNIIIKTVSGKVANASKLIDRSPLGEGNLDEYRDVWRDAAIKAMADFASEAVAAHNDAAAAAIAHAMADLNSDPKLHDEFGAGIQFANDVSKKYVAPFVVNLIKRQLAQEKVRGFKFSAADLLRKIDASFQDILNQRPWIVVDKSISASVGGRPVSIQSTIAPAGQLGHSDKTDRGPIASRYPDTIHGYMCHSATATHAVNLSVSSVSVGDPGGEKEVAFVGVRHGVHSAWGIRSADERAAANASRAEEAVIAAFLAKYDATGSRQPLPRPGADGATTIDLRMTSVSLLTPGTARHVLKAGSSVDERRMLMDQSAAWDAVARKGVEFRYKVRLIRIRPQILKFNFGVNEGAVNKIFKIAPDMAGGWDISSRMNKEAFDALKEEVDAFLLSNADEGKKAAARTLFDQCRRALESKAERSDSHDAFKLAARIAVLSGLIGKVPCWNCKSGKDRTGQMDVECKFLSTLIACGESIPAPGARLTKDEQSLLRAIALEGGNFEIQKMNTGIAGFKTGRVDSVAERLGGKEYREFHRGGSDHVSG